MLHITSNLARLKTKMATWYDSSSLQRQYYNPRNSMSITNTKGLLNAPGENNCFLNSAVQVLWHLDVFRRSFRLLTGHACMGNSCIFCALKVIFTQFQHSDESALPPNALRKALAETFKDQQRFQLGCMDDAAECFENILTRIHFHVAHTVKEDMCDAKHCLAHQKFAMTLIEQCECSCGATSEPLPFTQMVHYVSATALCTQAKLIIKENITSEPSMFSKLLANAGGVGDLRNCPSNCGKTIQIKRSLVNCPEIVSIGLVWDSDQPSIDHIMDVIRSLGTTIRLPYVFQGVFDERAHRSTLYLVGIVTYYGKHYSTFFFHTKLRVWIYFDDATVREIGNSWEDVVEKCRRGHYQPLLLLYADPHGTPISTDTAPQYVFKLPGHTQNTWGTDGACRSRHPSIPINIDPVSQDHNRCNSNSSGSSRSLSNHSSDSTGTVIYRPRETIPEVSTDTQSMSSAASTTDDAQNRKVRRSRSRARGHEMKKENYDTVSVSSSTSSNSSDKKKTRSKSLDRFRIKRQTSNVSESSRGSSTKEDYTDLNTMERRKPFQGIPIPPDRSSSTNIAGPKSPKAFKSPRVKRRGSFKGGKDNVRADIIRIPVTNNGDNQPDSFVYNPYGNLAVKKNEQIKSVETLKTDHSHWDDLQQIYQTPHANAENTGVGFPMAAPRSPQLKDLQQIHEQWLNDNKEKYGDDQRYWPVHGAPFNQPNEEYTDQTHFSRPLQYSQYTQQYRQQPIQQHIYYYPPQQQQQQQARYNLPSQVVPDTLSAHYQKSDVTNPKQLKRMTPKLVKQRNTENKPSIEPKQSKRYRRKSLGGMDTRGMDELREAIQPPQRPRSALPFRENMIRPEDRGYASGDEVRGGIIKSGFVTLPRKPKDGNKQLPATGKNALSNTSTGVKRVPLQRSASFHARSVKDDDVSAVIPTEYGPMVRHGLKYDLMKGQNRSSNSSAESFASSESSRHSDSRPEDKYKHNGDARNIGVIKPMPIHKDILKVDIPDLGQIGRRDSGYKSGDRTSGSSASSFSVDSPTSDNALHSNAYLPIKNLTRPADRNCDRTLPPSHVSSRGTSTHQNESTTSGQRSSNSSNDLMDLNSLSSDVLQCKDDPVDRLLQEAESLLDKSLQLEKKGDLATALCLCLNAITRLRSAMDQPGIEKNHRTKIILDTKLKSCLLKSQGLHHKLLKRRDDPSATGTIYSTYDDTVEDSLSTMVSSLTVSGKQSNLIDLKDDGDRKNEELQKQLSSLYSQSVASHSVPKQNGTAPAQYSVATSHYIPPVHNQNLNCARGTLSSDVQNTQRTRDTTDGYTATVRQHPDVNNYGQVNHNTRTQKSQDNLRYNEKLEGQPRVVVPNILPNHYASRMNHCNSQVGSYSIRQEEAKHAEHMKMMEGNVRWLENKNESKIVDNYVHTGLDHNKNPHGYGDLTHSSKLSRSTPNVTSVQRPVQPRVRTEQERLIDVQRQKLIILEKHKQMVAMQTQKHKEKQELIERETQQSAYYAMPMVPSEEYQQSSQNNSQSALQQWFLKEKVKRDMVPTNRGASGRDINETPGIRCCPRCQKREELLVRSGLCFMCDMSLQAEQNPGIVPMTTNGRGESTINYTPKPAAGVPISGTQVQQHRTSAAQTLTNPPCQSPTNGVIEETTLSIQQLCSKFENQHSGVSTSGQMMPQQSSNNTDCVTQLGKMNNLTQLPQSYNTSGYVYPVSSFQRNGPGYCTLPRKKVEPDSTESCTNYPCTKVPTSDSGTNFTRGTWSSQSMIVKSISKEQINSPSHHSNGTSDTLQQTDRSPTSTTTQDSRYAGPSNERVVTDPASVDKQKIFCKLCRKVMIKLPHQYCHNCFIYLSGLRPSSKC